MSTDADFHFDAVPESNAEAVANKIVFESIDLDGTGVVEILRLLVSRAEQMRDVNQQFGKFDAQLSTGHLPGQDDLNRELLHGLYEPICLKWFLARALRSLAKRLEFEVTEKQQHLRPIQKIVYAIDGDLESFTLRSSDRPESE